MRLLQGHSLADATQTAWQVLPKAWPTAGTYWPCVALLSYHVVPLQWRPLFGGVAMVAFQTFFLSAQAHKPASTAGVESRVESTTPAAAS